MKKLTLTLIACIHLLYCFSQDANEYRSANNPLYWKNKLPYEGYWQQDVAYKINASLDDKTDIVDGEEELTYWNNSPDELNFVYFHLYSNAQVKNSYLSSLYKNNNINVKYGKYQKDGKGTEITKLLVNGIEPKVDLDNTIIKVYLPQPLKPNESVTFKINFKTYFDNGTIRNRMKLFNAFGCKHYDLVHWYPRISVYDKKMGWDTDQHMDHEFYGDYGTFEVSLSFPNNYILEATGELQNENEVLPQELKNKLDIKNFNRKPWNEAPSVIITPDGTKKTWKYFATNVHDFAATADPTYRIGEALCEPKDLNRKPIRCIAMVQEPHAIGWQNAASYAAKVIQVYSEDFGMYEYPKMVVADAQDGMEYPMLTLDGGYDPDYRDLLAHEIGHNWFFGMIGSNETYRAMLDEGFTQFIENWAYEKIDGRVRVAYPYTSKYVTKHKTTDYVRNSEVYNGYMNDAIKGSDATLNTHSDAFNGAIRHGGGYSQVYFKTATMLYNLQYVLGDSLFLSAMQNYVREFKMAHPYIEDMRNSFIRHTKVDLNWFFDQWIETNKTIDYKVKSIKKHKTPGEYDITFERKGRMHMPLDFSVRSDSTEYPFHIPNTWFEKKTNATILPRWIGWDKVKPTYTAHIKIPGTIQNVVIDPTNRLADVFMANNSFKRSFKVAFDSKIYNAPDWTNYEVFYRPELWYNGYDGLKLGWHLNGNYMNYHHLFDATIWLNTGIAPQNIKKDAFINKYDDLNFRFNYRTATDKFMKGSSINLSAKFLDGLRAYQAGFERKDISGRNKVYMYFKSMYRLDENTLNYLLMPTEWTPDRINNTINVGLDHSYTYKYGTGNINLHARSTAAGSHYDYAWLALTVINKNKLGKKINFNTRTFVQFGSGTNWAKESSLFLAGANPEEMMDNKFVRSQGFFAPAQASFGAITNNFQYGGGLNLRGYAGYVAPETSYNGIQVNSYRGNSGAAVNAELEFNDLINFKPKLLRNWLQLKTYLFADAGIININTPNQDLRFGNIRMDAGIGATLTIKKFGPLQTVEPWTIRCDLPLLLNQTPALESDFFAFRWLIGISRAF